MLYTSQLKSNFSIQKILKFIREIKKEGKIQYYKQQLLRYQTNTAKQ